MLFFRQRVRIGLRYTRYFVTLTTSYDENELCVSHLQPKFTNVARINVPLILANANDKQESLANDNVSARQQCLYEGPSDEIYGEMNARNIMLKSRPIHSVGYNR